MNVDGVFENETGFLGLGNLKGKKNASVQAKDRNA